MKYLLYFWNEKIWVYSCLLGHLFIKYKTIFSISERWYLFTFGITSSKWGFFLTNSGVANGKDRLGLEFFLEWLLPDDKLEAVLVEDLFNVVSSVKPIYIVNMMNKNYISHSTTKMYIPRYYINFLALTKKLTDSEDTGQVSILVWAKFLPSLFGETTYL